MYRSKYLPSTRTFLGLLYLIIYIGLVTPISAASRIPSSAEVLGTPRLEMVSHGFNAKKKSSFKVNGQAEQVQRGITAIHFRSPEKFEFRTFDTHGSPEEAAEFTAILLKMQNAKAKFALLVHDSAAKSLTGQTGALQKMGFERLASLQSRQAYLMHNLNGSIIEKVHDTTLEETLTIPANTADETIYFPKISYEFKPNNNRYIAHAGGAVNGVKSTNTKDALDQNYAKGFRMFELDIIKTSDGHLVAAHDWGMWSRFTDYGGTLPPSLAEFKKHKIYGDYTTLDMKGINAWFAAHPDATLVTDKINAPVAFAEAFVDKDRLVMELFNLKTLEDAASNGINAMISQEPLMDIVGDKLDYLRVNDIEYVAVSRRIIASQKKLLLQLRDEGIKVYVYNVNFDPGKDEKYVQDNEIGLVYGMYADQWVFDQESATPSK